MGTFSDSVLEKPRVVCVDDEPLVNRALYRLLSREPYEVLVADTPRQALRYVKDYGADLVITDQRMPDMSGVELLREVRQVSPSTAGFILTAYPESVLADEPAEMPAPPIFTKPWDDETLRATIRDMLRLPAPETPATAVRTVLVPVDGYIAPELTLASVLPLLKLDPIRVVLLQVLPELGLHRDAYAYLERTRERLESEGVDAVGDVRWGDPARQILLHARHAHADLIVLSRSDATPFLRSTIEEKILDESPVPILVGRPEATVRSWKKILVPLDGSREAEGALPDAVRWAREAGAANRLMAVSPLMIPVGFGYMPYAPRIPDRLPYLTEVAKYISFEEVSVEAGCAEGDPAREIVRDAQESGVDLISLTSWRRSAWSRFFGTSVAQEVLRRSPCPVLLRPTG